LRSVFFVLLFSVSIVTNAFQMKREAYIDIPTANFNQGLYLNLSSSYPVKDVADVKFDPNIGIDFSYNKFGIAVKWYNSVDFAMDLSYQILTESGSAPGLAFGICEISNSKYVSPAGSEDVFNDENYTDRPPEVASAYLVSTKKLSENFEITAGLGRGRFVGYGPRSKNVNIDAFSDENHENWVFGLFSGMRVIFPNNLAFIIEGDARDVNLGMEYQNELVKGTLALNKLELFGNETNLSPRVSLNLSYKLMEEMKKTVKKAEKKLFPAAIKLIDRESREPVKGNTIITDTKGDTVKVSIFNNFHTFSLEPGIYTSFIRAAGYRDKEIAMTVKEGKSGNLFTIELSKIEETKKPVTAADSVRIIDNFEEIKDQVEGISIKFPLNRADLTPRALSILNRITELISDNKDVRLLIIGHTCSLGTYEANQKLSEERAESVKTYLIGRGIPAYKISTEGHGETDPIATNNTEAGRIKNRRAEFILYRVKE
jgi:outer membrane protein OmpA-like peptidoglycan-associated protein